MTKGKTINQSAPKNQVTLNQKQDLQMGKITVNICQKHPKGECLQ